MLYKEVIRFAVCLTAAPEALIELIFTRLTLYLRSNYFDNESFVFLRSLGAELKDKQPLNLLNNKYFNYTTKENPICFIPSRFYLFDEDVAKSKAVQYRITWAALKKSPVAECSIHVPPHALVNALKVLQEIQKKMQVVISSFAVLEDFSVEKEPFGGLTYYNEFITKLFKRTLTLDEHANVFAVRGFRLPQPTFSHIAQQLSRCTNIELLCFSDVQQNIPMKLGAALLSMSSLKMVNFQNTPMTRQSCQALLLGMTHCCYLTFINLSNSILSERLDYLLGGTNRRGFPFLKNLVLENTQLRIKDIKSIASAVGQSKLQSLACLVLSRNTLTDSIEHLVPLRNGHFLGYQSLNYLVLGNTKLTSADLRTLSEAIHLNKFPAINGLNISSNSLTGCTKYLLKCKEGCGLKLMEKLNLAYTNLTEEDLKSLAIVLSSLGLSKINHLNLSGNNLHGIIKELFTDTGVLRIQFLDLQNAKLGKEDILHLSNAVQDGKLPELREINLIGNNVEDVENELLTLSRACSIYYRKRKITIGAPLQATCDPEVFCRKIMADCQGSEIEFNFEFMELALQISLMSGLNLSTLSITGNLMYDLILNKNAFQSKVYHPHNT